MKLKLVSTLFAAALISSPVTLATSYAADKDGSFSSHGRYKVKGNVSVADDGTINISSFSTTPGPDLYIYVGNGKPKTLVAKLKRNSGNQSYKISPALAKSITSVHVHCKRFSKVFGTASVK